MNELTSDVGLCLTFLAVSYLGWEERDDCQEAKYSSPTTTVEEDVPVVEGALRTAIPGRQYQGFKQ